MIRTVLLAAAVSQILVAGAAFAQLERQHDVHVHGSAVGNLSMDGEQLRLELEIPGINLVGFEHAPNTDQQQAALDSTLAFLRAADWLVTDPRGTCELASVNAHTHGFSDDHHHEHDHDHKHEHEHDHASHDHAHQQAAEDHAHDHAEFHLVVMMECQSPDRLSWIELDLFDDYPANEELRIDVLTETVTTQTRLTPGNERILLQ